jgi:hypothetical protein
MALNLLKSIAGLSSNDCALAQEHVTALGFLLVIGPAPLLEERTCVSGQTCSVSDFSGQALSASDKLAILDTCGTADGLLQRAPTSYMHALLASAGTTSFSFGSALLSGAGGTYRMCWCAGGFSCSTAEDFRVDAGAFTLLGPAPQEQDRTCVMVSHVRWMASQALA